VQALACDEAHHYPEPDACYPRDLSKSQHWSIATLFGRIIPGPCQAAKSPAEDTICFNTPHDRNLYQTEGAQERKRDDGYSRCYVMAPDRDFGLFVPEENVTHANPVTRPPLFAERSITGHGQERGGVRALLTNPSPDTPVEFVYFETLPWFMKPYMHTLSAKVTSRGGHDSSPHTDAVIKDMYYRPGLDRVRGSQLELHMAIPPLATVTLTYAFEKAILRYTEYPPDANRGRDVAPAVIRIISGDAPDPPGVVLRTYGGNSAAYLRTTPLMLPLPTPDFSMPYNVIILTSTVIALAFGMVYNMLVRRFVAVDEGEEQGILAAVKGLVARLKGTVNKLKAGGSNSETDKKTQ
jgi:GPI-anchor transamidase subunit T